MSRKENPGLWRKSRYSNGSGSCVEVGQAPAETVTVRDTKQSGRGAVLKFSLDAWRAFTEQVKLP